MSLGNIYLTPRNIFIKVSQASVLIPVFTGLVNYKKLTTPYRILLYFFVASIGFEVQASITKVIFQNNMPGLHLFTLVEFLIFSIVYFYHFREARVLRFVIIVNMVIATAVSVTDAFFVHSIWQLNPLSRAYASTSLLSYTLIYFHHLFRDDTALYSTAHPMFWINAGAILYFGGNSPYFMGADMFMHNHGMANLGLYVHNTVNIISYYLYAQAFKCFRKQKVVR